MTVHISRLTNQTTTQTRGQFSAQLGCLLFQRVAKELQHMLFLTCVELTREVNNVSGM